MRGDGWKCDQCGLEIVVESSGRDHYMDRGLSMLLPPGWVTVFGYVDLVDLCGWKCASLYSASQITEAASVVDGAPS